MEHTKDWYVQERLSSANQWIYRNTETLLAELIGNDTREVKETANRLCLCYNAMQGLTNEQVTELRETVKELREAMDRLIYTASKLWDNQKPIKETDIMTVTHPIIEDAKQALTRSKHLS